MLTGSAATARLSLNQATTKYWPLPDVVAGCVRAGITAIGLWREPVAEHGLRRSAELVRDAGLTVSSLCRGGFVTAVDPDLRRRALQDNRDAIDEAAELGTPVLVLVCGGLPAGSRDLDGARGAVRDALGELAPYAGERGVRLAIEPLHPMFCSDRSVVSTLDQAVDLAEPFPVEQVGVVVDTYHVWWDPAVYRAIARAGPRIAAFQVADWVTPLPPDVLLGRGMIGDGCVELRRLREAVDRAGYRGRVEVEIFNAALWDTDGDSVLADLVARYPLHVG